jgi:hypothetical protein
MKPICPACDHPQERHVVNYGCMMLIITGNDDGDGYFDRDECPCELTYETH